MFRLEKIFQNDDLFFINISIIIKSIFFFLSIYVFSILEFNTIYDLFNYDIFKKSEYFVFSFYLTLFYYLSIFFLRSEKKYLTNFLSFLKKDFFALLISFLLIFSLFFVLKVEINNNLAFIYLFLFILFNLFILNMAMNSLYSFLINKNIIQRNIMLVGSPNNIREIVKHNPNKINVYKCCLVNIDDFKKINELRLELKIPVFSNNDDIRSILEYHSLGQIWILNNNDENIYPYLYKLLKFSVDLLIINLHEKPILTSEILINNKYKFINYEISKFFGFNLFVKILLDKLFSIFFMILLLPIFILAILFIYLEDGFPLFFTQDRTGWDGRRFKIFKLRSLKNDKFDTKVQVTINDSRLLKVGRIIRRLSIDELPQFYNVLIGDMSIVGPRPHMVEHDILYSGIFASFLKRHKANPGLTGWAQVSGYRGATPTDNLMQKRMEHDLWYLNNWSNWLDLYIIFKTIYVIFKKPR